MPITVAIIGAGPLGRWLALAAARAGYRVLLEDVMPANLHHAREALRQELSPTSLPMVDFVSTIEDAVRDADLAIDCVPDELESKLEILWLLDRMAPPRTVLATPTTRLSITDLAACTYRAEKCVAIAAEASALAGSAPTEISSAPPRRPPRKPSPWCRLSGGNWVSTPASSPKNRPFSPPSQTMRGVPLPRFCPTVPDRCHAFRTTVASHCHAFGKTVAMGRHGFRPTVRWNGHAFQPAFSSTDS